MSGRLRWNYELMSSTTARVLYRRSLHERQQDPRCEAMAYHAIELSNAHITKEGGRLHLLVWDPYYNHQYKIEVRNILKIVIKK